jgi:hypothetical protein
VKTAELRDAIAFVLDQAAASVAPEITEAQFLRELVSRFGNTGELSPIIFAVPDFLTCDANSIERIHVRFREDLQAIVDGKLSPTDRRRIYKAADRILMVPRTADDGTISNQYMPEGLEAALAHAIRLLLDPEKAYGNDLKQCQWEECNRIEDARKLAHIRRFFFVSERREAQVAAGKEATGKVPDRYCCEEHMREAHRKRATEATLRRRREQKEANAKAAAARAAKRK